MITSINMLLENPLFNIPFFSGLLFVCAGAMMLVFPPKKINWLYGYRTNRAMKNQETWDFSQKFAAKETMKIGLLFSVLALLACVTNFSNSVNLIIGIGLLHLMAIVLIIRVERAIKRKFPEQ